MRFGPSLMLCLALGVSLSVAPGCATKEYPQQSLPPAADLRPEPKPQLKPADLGSEAALDAHEIALEAWGEAGWRQVERLCRWAVDLGAELPFKCSAPPPDS